MQHLNVRIISMLGPLMLVALASAACSPASGGAVGVPTLAKSPAGGGAVGVTALSTSTPAQYLDPSGAFVAMPTTALTVDVGSTSTLITTFSARGTVQPPTPPATQIPIVFIRCQIDGSFCQTPDSIEFLFPQFCCDTRSFTWVTQNIPAGSHKVTILWGMGNPTQAIVTNRTLVVETVAL
jgi:hypothetical protein